MPPRRAQRVAPAWLGCALRGAALIICLAHSTPAPAQPPGPSTADDAPLIESSLGPLPGGPSAGLSIDGTGQRTFIGRGARRVPINLHRGTTLVRLPATGPKGRHARRAQPPRAGGLLAIPTLPEDQGPPTGLSLDAAIEILVHQSLSLQAKALELPQAEADVVTAGLRGNPFVFGDAQLVPYGHYNSATNPGGPTQYDVNVTLPVDWNLKRRRRVAVAERAQSVVAALYHNAVRLEIDSLYTAYVDVLAARETVRLAGAAGQQLDTLLTAERQRLAGAEDEVTQLDQFRLARDEAQLTLSSAESDLRSANRRLAALLNLPPALGPTLELRGTIRPRVPPAPPVEELVALALSCRSDLAAFRLGVERAAADVSLAESNKFSDLYLLYQPLTYQDNSPFGTRSSHSWALGATMAVPIWDRNQGTIRRAQLNVAQTRIELAALERTVLTEVEEAYEELEISRAAVERIAGKLLPDARRVLDDNLQLYRRGEEPLVAYLSAQREYGDWVRQYRDALVRYRRAMLDLNTAVGQRILP